MRALALVLAALAVGGSGLVGPPALAATSTLARLQQRAHAGQLADSPRWHALMHYEADRLGRGVHSTVASDWFFLADTGRTDPAAELDATLAALLDNRPVGPRERPAGCQFIARRRFLVQALAINTDQLPAYDCRAYRQWRRALSPRQISLVFPTAFPNSPSSMFGHTLLRIDSARKRRGTELLSYAANFAAAAGDDAHGLGFVYKGLTGGYPGVFGLFPYYEKVKQYAWIEHRDVWAYPLNLSHEEMNRLVDHLWEMDGVHFDYYFFNKNCSYQLLSLIEVARPSLRLTERFDWYAIPADTIRALADVPGLMGTPKYRPSLETTLRWQAGQLTDHERKLAIDVAADRLALDAPALRALDDARRAAVLEVAHDYLYYQIQSASVAAQSDQAHANAILLARSRIHRPSPFDAVPAPEVAPDAGHRSLRLTASTVYADDTLSLGLRVRPAYHDLLDAPGGYTANASVDVLDLGLRLDPDDGTLRIDDLTLVGIESLGRRSDLFKPISFRIETGLRRRPSSRVFTDAANDLGYYLEGGPGLAWGSERVTGYVFGLASLDANGALAPAYALGAGGAAGVQAQPTSDLQLRLEAGMLEYAVGADGYYRWARLEPQFNFTRNLGLRGELGWENTAADAGVRAVIGLNAYF